MYAFSKTQQMVACMKDTQSVEYLILYILWIGHSFQANIFEEIQ